MSYSYEARGDGWTLYLDRTDQSHGYNLGTVTNEDDAALLVRRLTDLQEAVRVRDQALQEIEHRLRAGTMHLLTCNADPN